MLSILQMKSFTGTKKIELNLNIGFGRAILSIISISRRKLWNQLSNGCSSYKGGTKTVPSRFSYKQPLKCRENRYYYKKQNIPS